MSLLQLFYYAGGCKRNDLELALKSNNAKYLWCFLEMNLFEMDEIEERFGFRPTFQIKLNKTDRHNQPDPPETFQQAVALIRECDGDCVFTRDENTIYLRKNGKLLVSQQSAHYSKGTRALLDGLQFQIAAEDPDGSLFPITNNAG